MTTPFDMQIVNYWYLPPHEQAKIRTLFPLISDIVYSVIDMYEYSILAGHWDECLIEMIEHHSEYAVSSDEIEVGLQELDEQDLVDYDGYRISAIYSPYEKRDAYGH